ncbi:MAG TPA: hypothetical protein DD738_11860 [Ruminiclostridium sp.]|nr:hypothetical protein [Ruminiclostridium sp.]
MMLFISDGERIHYGFSQKLIKNSNSTLLFNLIRKEMPISRAALAKKTRLSPTTVSILIDEMIQNKWICETGPGENSDRGRKPILLEVNASRGYVITIEIYSGGYKCTLYDICLKKIGDIGVRMATYNSRDICSTISELLEAKHIVHDRLIGIHVIFPGLFDAETGKLRFSVVIPFDEMVDTNVVEVLKEQFAKAIVMISNNGGVIAFSEFIAEGDNAGVPLLSVNIDEGISGGMVLNDARNNTKICLPLEIGHIIVDNDGPPCKCGNRGCLETLCSTPALFHALNERAGLGLKFRETFGAECNHAAMEIAASHFRAKDPKAMPVFQDYVYKLCCGLVSVVNLCNIKCIHIGGSISKLGSDFADLIRQTLREHFVMLNASLDISLELFSNDNERICRTAAIMTMDELFKNS